jgi:hypothetical protein
MAELPPKGPKKPGLQRNKPRGPEKRNKLVDGVKSILSAVTQGFKQAGKSVELPEFQAIAPVKQDTALKAASNNEAAPLPKEPLKAKKSGGAPEKGKKVSLSDFQEFKAPAPKSVSSSSVAGGAAYNFKEFDLNAGGTGKGKQTKVGEEAAGNGLAGGKNNITGKDYDTSINKDVELNLRYRIPKKLANLEEVKYTKIATYIDQQIESSQDERTEFIDRLANYREIWTNFQRTGLNPAFEGASDVHVPLAFSHIKAMHARIYNAVMGMDPIFSLKPRTAVSEEKQETKETILNWAVTDFANNGDGWEAAIDQDIWSFVADGTSVTKQPWKRDVRKFVDVEEKLIRPIQLDDNGHPKYEEKEVEREEIVYDGPMLETVKLEDFYIIGDNAEDVDSADMVAHRQQYTRSDLIKMSNLGFFRADATQRVVAKEPQVLGDTFTKGDQSVLKQLDEYASGINKGATSAGIRSYIIYEVYFRYDIDDDGIDEELVAWMEESSREILRLTYLERVGPGGKRPFTLKKLIPRKGSPYGIGFGEMLYGLNNEVDAIHNMRLDFGTLQNVPFFFYRAASGVNPQTIKVGPGKGIPLDDPNGDVSFPQFQGNTAYGFNEEAKVTSYAENATSLSPLALGQQSQQGLGRTATGAAALVSEMNVNLDILIRRYQRGFKRNLHILDLQLQDLLPLGSMIRVAGLDGKNTYMRFDNRDDLKWSTDYELAGNSSTSNKAVQRETAQMILQTVSNPIFLQAGIASSGNLYQAARNMLVKSEVKNIDAYLTKPEDVQDNPYSAKDELSAILGGIRLPKDVKDKHEQKLALFNEFEQSDDFGLLDDEHLPLYLEYKDWHEQMANAMNAQANNPLIQNQGYNPGVSAEIAAGMGNPQGGVPQNLEQMTSAGIADQPPQA